TALEALQKVYGKEWNTLVNKQQNAKCGNRTPLACCIGANHRESLETIKYLLANGADPLIPCIINSNDSTLPCTPLAYCVYMQRVEEVKLFLDYVKKNDRNSEINKTFSWQEPDKEVQENSSSSEEDSSESEESTSESVNNAPVVKKDITLLHAL